MFYIQSHVTRAIPVQFQSSFKTHLPLATAKRQFNKKKRKRRTERINHKIIIILQKKTRALDCKSATWKSFNHRKTRAAILSRRWNCFRWRGTANHIEGDSGGTCRLWRISQPYFSFCSRCCPSPAPTATATAILGLFIGLLRTAFQPAHGNTGKDPSHQAMAAVLRGFLASWLLD